MRRLAVLLVVIVAAGAWWVAGSAGADDSHTYRIEMYNAFGIVNGSDVRIGGVTAGSVSSLDVDAKKRAVATVTLSGPLSVLGKDTQCASQPQSLIAEYFIDCTPKGPPLPDGGEIPANHVRMTVQTDLVTNTLRTSYRDRLTMLINEFGTGLAGNANSLNQAIRLGSPALFNLRKVLDILAGQAATIRNLNADSDQIIGQLADNRANVVKFIQTAGRTAAISATRRGDLSIDFNRLDDFLHELGPTVQQLGVTARQSTPLLRDLHAAAPGLNTLAKTLPAFDRASASSLTALGRAAVPGRKAFRQGLDEIQALGRAGKNAYPVGDVLAKFLLDLDSPSRAVNVDMRAANSCAPGTKHPKTLPCYSTGRKAPTGYDGDENLLNWLYYLSGATNEFDQIGHATRISLYGAPALDACGNFNTGHNATTGAPGVPSKSGGTTTRLQDTAPCVDWLGPNQPGINENLHLPPYDPSVCPNGTAPSAALQYCNPAGPKQSGASPKKLNAAAKAGATSGTRSGPGGAAGQVTPSGGGAGGGGATGGGGSGRGLPPVPNLPPGVLPNSQRALRHLEHVLGLPPGTDLGGALGGHGIGGLIGPNGLGGALGGQQKSGPGRQGSSSAPSNNGLPGATQNLLDYLLGDGGA